MQENKIEMMENPIRPDYSAKILELIRGRISPGALRGQLEDFHSNDLAEAMELLSLQERKRLYPILQVECLGDILESIDNPGMYLEEMELRTAAAILSEMEADAAVTALRGIGKEKRQVLLELLDQDARKDILLLASYDESEIGSRMSTNCVIVRENLTIKQALDAVVAQAAEKDNISRIYAVDEQGCFYGAIELKELILTAENRPLEDVIVTSYPYLYSHEEIEDCMELLKNYSEDSIPVLDQENHILGVITAKDVIEVIDEELSEDYAMLAGLSSGEDLAEPVGASMKKRLPWLFVLMLLGILISSVVGIFEQVVSQLTIIMTFQSLILDMSGNAGTQSLAVTIRVLMDERLTMKKKLGLIWKEVRVGFLNGALIGGLSFVLLGIFLMAAKGKPAGFAFAVSGCIAAAMLCAMVLSSFSGTVIPMLFHKIGIDPAVASGPLITTLNDLAAVVVYYGLSWLLLLQVLHLGG